MLFAFGTSRAAAPPSVRRQKAEHRVSQRRRFTALLLGIGVTALGRLSKLTAPLAIPGELVASLAGRLTTSFTALTFAFALGNLLFWTVVAYFVLGLRARHEPAA